MSDVRPRWALSSSHEIPFCSEGDCPSYDGKRCMILARRPSDVCEPAVEVLVAERNRLRAQVEELQRELAAARAERDELMIRARPGPTPAEDQPVRARRRR
jgi:hypothetical protein